MKSYLKLFKAMFVFWLVLLFLVFLLSRGRVYAPSELSYGVTFSRAQAASLGLDPRAAYLALLDDLGVRKLRLSAYWNETEPAPGTYRWDELDWMIDEAANREAEIILAVGARLPRWPECHQPDWAARLPKGRREEALLNYISAAIARYRDREAIVAWQVENEPFLSHFGHCPPFDAAFLDQEIALARRLDSRPVVVTDSGELSVWIPAARRADIFGTSLYRHTYSNVLKRYIHYPITPAFFRFKRNLTRLFTRPEKMVVIELQAEPWAPLPFWEVSRVERERTMSPAKFRETIAFARQTGFQEFYLWGAEYWYWEKTVNDDDSMWNEARKLLKPDAGTKQL